MKNMILMMSKIKVGGGTLLTSILAISILGILFFLILNRNQKMKCLKKLTSVALILTMLLLPFSNLLNVWAEGVTITTDDNKKVTNTTNLIVEVGDDNTDIFKAYKVLDTYYDSSTNEMSYKFTPEFSNFLKTSGNNKLINLTIDDYIAYGNIDSNLSSEEQKNIEKEYNSMIDNFAKYIKKGTNTLPKNYELTNNVGVSKTATVEVGSYLILPAVLSNTPYIRDGFLNYNYYGALIANAIFKVDNGSWSLTDCEVISKDQNNSVVAMFFDMPINDLNQENFTEDSISTDMEFYNKEYTLLVSISESNKSYEDTAQKLQITLPQGVTLVDSNDLNNIYNVDGELRGIYQATSDGQLPDEPNEDGSPNIFATVKTEDVELEADDGTITTNKVITIIPTGNAPDGIVIGIRVKLNSDKEKLVFGLDGNVIKTSYTFTVDSNTDPITTRTINLQNKAFTYGLQILNKSQSDNSYLSGAVFGIYTDADCTDTNKVGELNIDETVENQPTGRYAGLPSGTYYVKQLKAATGYRLSTDVANITIDSANKDYFKLEVINTKMGLLPTTGGLGTIIYTLIGLIVIGIASYAIIKYSKRQINS